MNKDINHTPGSSDQNPERHFFRKRESQNDITDILAQKAINRVDKNDTTPDKNAEVDLQLTYHRIIENQKDIDNYLDYMKLIAVEEGYEPKLTKVVCQSFPLRKKKHDDINIWIEAQKIDNKDTFMLPHLLNIVTSQERLRQEIETELPKVKHLVKTHILESAAHKKIYNTLQGTADYVMVRGMLLHDFSKVDKNLLDPIDWETFAGLQKHIHQYAKEAEELQDLICQFLGKWAAIALEQTEIYQTYKNLRRRSNKYDADTIEYYKLMLKYEDK